MSILKTKILLSLTLFVIFFPLWALVDERVYSRIIIESVDYNLLFAVISPVSIFFCSICILSWCLRHFFPILRPWVVTIGLLVAYIFWVLIVYLPAGMIAIDSLSSLFRLSWVYDYTIILFVIYLSFILPILNNRVLERKWKWHWCSRVLWPLFIVPFICGYVYWYSNLYHEQADPIDTYLALYLLLLAFPLAAAIKFKKNVLLLLSASSAFLGALLVFEMVFLRKFLKLANKVEWNCIECKVWPPSESSSSLIYVSLYYCAFFLLSLILSKRYASDDITISD